MWRYGEGCGGIGTDREGREGCRCVGKGRMGYGSMGMSREASGGQGHGQVWLTTGSELGLGRRLELGFG